MGACASQSPAAFDVSLEIAASWQRLLAGVCVQQGQSCSDLSTSLQAFHPFQVLCLEHKGWELLGVICAYPCRSQPMPGTMEQVPWEPPLSEVEQQEWLNLEPKGWAANSSKYPLALPALTVMLRRQLCMLIVSAGLGGGELLL